MVTLKCSQCNKIVELDITEEELQECVNNGVLIQVAFPHLTDDQREILLSGLCGYCFDRLFACDE